MARTLQSAKLAAAQNAVQPVAQSATQNTAVQPIAQNATETTVQTVPQTAQQRAAQNPAQHAAETAVELEKANTSKPRRLQKLLGHAATAALAGVSVLGMLRVFTPLLGFTIKINMASFLVAVFLGAPGMIMLLLLRVLCLGG